MYKYVLIFLEPHMRVSVNATVVGSILFRKLELLFINIFVSTLWY